MGWPEARRKKALSFKHAAQVRLGRHSWDRPSYFPEICVCPLLTSFLLNIPSKSFICTEYFYVNAKKNESRKVVLIVLNWSRGKVFCIIRTFISSCNTFLDVYCPWTASQESFVVLNIFRLCETLEWTWLALIVKWGSGEALLKIKEYTLKVKDYFHLLKIILLIYYEQMRNEYNIPQCYQLLTRLKNRGKSSHKKKI